MHDLVMTNSSGNLVLGMAAVRADDTWDMHDCMFGRPHKVFPAIDAPT